ncbi:MAG: metalloregulator ArsR/SmtB family transcription factor [Chloroflexota bacterium]
MSSHDPNPKISWDVGTAHDLFISLDVLHHPERFGLRPAWAAGVRSRLPSAERELLQQAHTIFFKGPLFWIYNLPAPKNGASAIKALAQIAPEDRFRTLLFFPNMPHPIRTVLERVDIEGSWSRDDLRKLRKMYPPDSVSRKALSTFLDFWAQSRTLGDRYLQALTVYYDAFFAEEEKRIAPALEEAVERVKALADQLDILTLLEEISGGVRFTPEELDAPELVLIPSFWLTPLITLLNTTSNQALCAFGARPANASLVPGEMVPDALFLALKALADPTRLRILRYLMAEPLTPTELADRLRLRAPTVVHHLRTLRLAGLVHLTLESGKRVNYAARPEAVDTMVTALKGFLDNKPD